jgi:hypothetical protein
MILTNLTENYLAECGFGAHLSEEIGRRPGARGGNVPLKARKWNSWEIQMNENTIKYQEAPVTD